jgi:hypothetical protein
MLERRIGETYARQTGIEVTQHDCKKEVRSTM